MSRQILLPCFTDAEIDSTTLDVLVKGKWAAHLMTKPFHLTKERLQHTAMAFVDQVKVKLELEETPEVAVRHCRGLDSQDGSKRTILVRLTYKERRVKQGYALISCADAEEHCLLLFQGLAAVRHIFEAFLEHNFHCQVVPLPLTSTDLSLFLTTWMRFVGGQLNKLIKLKMTHSTIKGLQMTLSILAEKAMLKMQQLELDRAEEIFEEDAERFVARLCKEFASLTSVKFSAFSLKSVHLPGGSLHQAGSVLFSDRDLTASVLWYLTKVADASLEPCDSAQC